MDPEPVEQVPDTQDDSQNVQIETSDEAITSGEIVTNVSEPDAEEDWDAEMSLDNPTSVKKVEEDGKVEEEGAEEGMKPAVDEEADEDWDVEMDLGKTGGAKAVPSPPANASSASWHASMAAVVTANAGFTGTITRLGGTTKSNKSDVEESWDDSDFDLMSSEETPRVSQGMVPHTKLEVDLSDWDEDEEDAIPTIKIAAGQSVLPKPVVSSTPPRNKALVVEEDDFEEDFDLPEDLSQLSLRPLKHRSSKANLEGWGDQTASSTAYSSEASSGFGPHESSSSTSTSAYTGPETDDDDEESMLEGLVVPEGLFDDEKDNNRQVHKIIEEKKRIAASEIPAIIASPQEDDDFESGLVIDDETDFNLAKVKQHRASLSGGRSVKSLSLQGFATSSPGGRPSSRAHSLIESPEQQRVPLVRPKSPLGRSWSTVVREGSRSRPSSPQPGVRSPPPSQPGIRSPPTTFAALREARSSFHSPIRPNLSSPPPPSSFAAAKESLRRQTSNNTLGDGSRGGNEVADLQKRAIVRKSSLSSIDVTTMNAGSSVRVTLKRPASGMDVTPPVPVSATRTPHSATLPTSISQAGRFNTPASARANSLHNPIMHPNVFSLAASASRIQQQSPNLVPPTPPGTPSSNPIALRLTMSTSSSRAKSRPSLVSVFPSATTISRPTYSSAVKSPSLQSARSPPARSPLGTPGTPTTAASHGHGSPLSSPKPRPGMSRSSTLTSVSASIPHPPQAKILKRPKRLRAYGDGTELDAIEDLPTDRDKEGRFRVVPKGYSSGGKVVRRTSDAGREPAVDGGVQDSVEGSKLAQRRRADLNSARASISSTATATPTLGKIPLSPIGSPKASVDSDKRRSIGGVPFKRRPVLIRNLNGPGAAKVVNGMRWNPRTLRWEGNEQVLRDFDNVISSSSRPALITNLTASTMGSPVSSVPGARVVGNMLFDPVKMCWVSQLPEEEEPDVFADMADDEDDDDWDKNKGGTIRASSGLAAALYAKSPSPRPEAPPGKVLIDRVSPAKGGSGVLVVVGGDGNPSPSQSSFSRGQSELESGSDGDLREPNEGVVSDELLEETNGAEERHREEMKGWLIDPHQRLGFRTRTPSNTNLEAARNTYSFPAYGGGGQDVSHAEMDRSYLYEIRTAGVRRN